MQIKIIQGASQTSILLLRQAFEAQIKSKSHSPLLRHQAYSSPAFSLVVHFKQGMFCFDYRILTWIST